MRTKVLSGVVIACFFLAIQGLALSAIPPKSYYSGFLEFAGLLMLITYIATGTFLGAFFTIKWFVK